MGLLPKRAPLRHFCLNRSSSGGRNCGAWPTPNTAVIHLVDIVKEFHDGSFTNIPTSLQSTFDSMRTADSFVFATPVHWFNMSALMKCFIDWLTSLEQDTCELEEGGWSTSPL
jgi:NAD(P)H-dependent FMN reductase